MATRKLACRASAQYFLNEIMVAIFDFNGIGRLRRVRNLYQGGSRRSKTRRGVRVGECSPFSLLLPPPSNSKRIMAGRVKERELITLTPAYEACTAGSRKLSAEPETSHRKGVSILQVAEKNQTTNTYLAPEYGDQAWPHDR